MTKRNISLLVLLFVSLGAYAQPGNDSPYSSYRLGNPLDIGTIRSAGIGGLNIALDDQESRTFNFKNPASYAYLDSQNVVFDVAASWSLATLEDGGGSENVNKANFSYITLGFPVTKWWKAGFGLRPMSTTNYSVSRADTLTDIGPVKNIFQGNGGINQVFFGSAFKIYKGISVGININYVFGNVATVQRLEFEDEFYFNTRNEKRIDIGSLYLDYGLQYATKIKDNNLVIGITAAAPWNLSASQTDFAQTYTLTSLGQDLPRDTLFFNESANSSVKLPLKLGGGLSYTLKNKLLMGAQFNQEYWSGFRNIGNVADTSLADSWRVSFGIEYRPGNKDRGFWNYFKKIDYRIGGFYSNSPLISNGEQVPEYGMTLGFGLPIRHRSTSGPLVTSKVNVAAEIGQRGNLDTGQLTEQYINLKIGFTMNDMWFYKRKYD